MPRSSLRLRTFALAVACAGGPLACGGGGENPGNALESAADTDAAAETSAAATGSAGSTAQEPAIPGFPIASPEGGEVITDGWDGTTGHITVQYPAARHDEVVAFYDEYTADDGWNRSEIGQGEVPSVNYMNLAEGQNITVGPPTGESMLVTLTAS